MRTIKQRGGTDCGVGCVAMLAGVSYEEAFEAVYPDGKRRITSTNKLRAALIKLGRPPVEGRMVSKKTTKLKSLPHDALLKVQPTTSVGKHWVVWDAKHQKKRDPWPEPMRHKVVCYLLVP